MEGYQKVNVSNENKVPTFTMYIEIGLELISFKMWLVVFVKLKYISEYVRYHKMLSQT